MSSQAQKQLRAQARLGSGLANLFWLDTPWNGWYAGRDGWRERDGQRVRGREGWRGSKGLRGREVSMGRKGWRGRESWRGKVIILALI